MSDELEQTKKELEACRAELEKLRAAHDLGWAHKVCPNCGADMMTESRLASPAGPDALAEEKALEEFTAYFVQNYPGPRTIIHDPKWHAPKIFRAAQRALRSRPAQGDSRDAEAALRELVELKNLKDRDVVFNGDAYQDYALRKPLAWAKAREVIASLDAAVSQQEKRDG